MKPTKPGFYWYKGSIEGDEWEPVVIYAKQIQGKTVVGRLNDDLYYDLDDFKKGEWGEEIRKKLHIKRTVEGGIRVWIKEKP